MKRKAGQRTAGLRRRVGVDTVCRSTRRALLIALGAGAFAVPLATFAQQPAVKVARIGLLNSESASAYASRVDALRAGLRDLGYVEGKNIVIEYRRAEGKYDRLPGLAVELVRLKVDVLVTFGQKAAVAAQHATTTIPIVFTSVGDAVAIGLVASLARPGGNITGLAAFGPELMAKKIELIKELIPRVARVAVLLNSDNPTKEADLQATESAARSLKIVLQPFEVRAPDEFDSVFAAMAKGRVGAVVLQGDTIFGVNAKMVADLAAKKQFPAVGGALFPENGGLIGYGINFIEQYRRAAVFVDKILRGVKPADIPVEQPTKFELVINMKTAKALGLKIPNSILVRADRVIE